MGPEHKEMVDNATARSQVYAMLAAVFRAEPTEAFLAELRGPQFSGAFSDLGVDLGTEFYAEPDLRLRDALTIEFTRLFLGPGRHISAHESIFAEVDGDSGGHWGAKTVVVKKFIEATGMEYESDYKGLPDHVSVELEFMQKLAEWEAQKWAEGDGELAKNCLSVQKRFAEDHLLNWIPDFCREVIAKADGPFYREMAKVTMDFLAFDHKSIDESLSLGE